MENIRVVVVSMMLCLLSGTSYSFAQQKDDKAGLGWFNETELSLALTGGNSAARTFSFGNSLRHAWDTSRFQVRVNGIRTDTSLDPFLLVDSGIRFRVGGSPETVTKSLVRPSPQPDVEKYLISGRYDQEFNESVFWNIGGSWDRNSDAGLLDRYVVFGGVGSVWSDSETVHFSTTYAVSYTDREEVTRNPEKAPRFGGARLGWEYLNRLGNATVYENDFTTNINVRKVSDYSLNMVNALSVSISTYLSLRVSLQLLFENEPALDDVDIIARTEIIDPDGVPGSGDEIFQTVTIGGAELTVGKGRIQKDRLDSIVRTALVVSF